MKAKLKILDLFCGAGGLALGARWAGFDIGLSVDIDPVLTSAHTLNFPRTPLWQADLAEVSGKQLKMRVDGPIEGIVGGPPCQGFSSIGRRDPRDPRRQLLWHFFRLVREIEPSFFVMENVKGLAYSDSRGLLTEALSLVADRYAILGPVICDAADFGAATRRKRIFVIGIHRQLGSELTESDLTKQHSRPATVKEAIADLQSATFIEDDESGFDHWRISRPGPALQYASKLRNPERTFTGHRIVQHRAEVAHRFSKVSPGKIDPIGRHQRLDWTGQSPTLRAGTGSDRGSYQAVRPLHPDEPRVITVREAARLQGFPDHHYFHPTIWHSFRMIGNSVSPILAGAIFTAIREKIGANSQTGLLAAE